MKIKINAEYVILHGEKYLKDRVLDLEINGTEKKALVLNGQAEYWHEDEK